VPANPANTITPRREIKNYQIKSLINLRYTALGLDAAFDAAVVVNSVLSDCDPDNRSMLRSVHVGVVLVEGRVPEQWSASIAQSQRGRDRMPSRRCRSARLNAGSCAGEAQGLEGAQPSAIFWPPVSCGRRGVDQSGAGE
jgi:hypothetical protein